MPYAIGLDYGTNSVRCAIVDTKNGAEIATDVFAYPSGSDGCILDPADHNLVRQNPNDYIEGLKKTVTNALQKAKENVSDFDVNQVIGIGIDTTGSTPIPVDENLMPLANNEKFKNNPNAYAWLWKDHTAYKEAMQITELAEKIRPEYLKKCGGTYSSEWFFSKILHCLNVDPDVYNAAYTWLEHCDFMTNLLAGITDIRHLKRSRCAAGHKAMFSSQWGGYPDEEFLTKLAPEMEKLAQTLPKQTYTIGTPAGTLSEYWAQTLGLPKGIVISVGAIDAHLGAVGAGIKENSPVKILGTSSCDMVVWPIGKKLDDIPGICGIVDGSILPEFWGLEAGQAAVGDIFNWFVNYIAPGGKDKGSHENLTKQAETLKPGQSGLLGLDWNNGNRNILADQRLTGLLLGQTLMSTPAEIYRALIEATAFGSLVIIDRFEEYGVKISQIITCGGIAEKNSLVMQIYADITGREIKLAGSSQTCALGAAIAAAVAAGSKAGGYDNFAQAQAKMTHLKERSFTPNPENNKIYQRLYKLYRQLYFAFGSKNYSDSLYNVMKDLLAIKEEVV